MSKTIPGVPESITREQYLSLFRAAGITPEQTRDLRMTPSGIRATVFELDDAGHKVIGHDGYAKHAIFIPVIN